MESLRWTRATGQSEHAEAAPMTTSLSARWGFPDHRSPPLLTNPASHSIHFHLAPNGQSHRPYRPAAQRTPDPVRDPPRAHCPPQLRPSHSRDAESQDRLSPARQDPQGLPPLCASLSTLADLPRLPRSRVSSLPASPRRTSSSPPFAKRKPSSRWCANAS